MWRGGIYQLSSEIQSPHSINQAFCARLSFLNSILAVRYVYLLTYIGVASLVLRPQGMSCKYFAPENAFADSFLRKIQDLMIAFTCVYVSYTMAYFATQNGLCKAYKHPKRLSTFGWYRRWKNIMCRHKSFTTHLIYNTLHINLLRFRITFDYSSGYLVINDITV